MLPTPELLAHRRRMTGDDSLSDHDPMAVLLGRGLIERDHYDAAGMIRAAHHAVYGRSAPKTSDPLAIPAGDAAARLLVAAQGDAERERAAAQRWQRILDMLDRSGATIRQQVMRLAVHGETDRLVEDVIGGAAWTGWHERSIAGLRGALADLARGRIFFAR